MIPAKTALYDFTPGPGNLLGPAAVSVLNGPILNHMQTTSLQQAFTHPVLGGPRVTVVDPIDFACKTAVTVKGGSKNATVYVNYSTAADELTKLAKLHDAGKLSDQEFEQAKAKVVA